MFFGDILLDFGFDLDLGFEIPLIVDLICFFGDFLITVRLTFPLRDFPIGFFVDSVNL